MIDTVRYLQERELIEKPRYGTLTLDRKSNLRVGAKGDRITWVEVSLPKLLFGTNGKLITSNEQIAQALAKADALIDDWAKPATTPKDFTRVDLVWQFQVPTPGEFFFAHQHCNHPEVRTKVFVFRDSHRVTGVQWEGGEKQRTMHIKMYDKTSYEVSRPRKIVRVEIMLRGRRLRNKLAHRKQITNLDVEACYRCYRATLLKFRPQPVVPFSAKDEALAFAESEGVPVFNMLARRVNKKTIYRLRKVMVQYSFRRFRVDWEKLLPVTYPPQVRNAGALPVMKFTKRRTRIKGLL